MRVPGFKLRTLMFVSAVVAPIHGAAVAQESAKLPPAIAGFLVVDRHGDIKAVQLPSGRTATVRPSEPVKHRGSPSIHALSGPDSKGRIAFIEDFDEARRSQRRHLLKTIRLDGRQETTLFSRPGTANPFVYYSYNPPIGQSLALSPVGGRVAFLTDPVKADPMNALMWGTTFRSLEIWDIETGQSSKTSVGAIDCPMAWFPDGKRLAYVKFVDPPQPGASRAGARDTGPRKTDRVAAVFVWDVDAGTESFLHLGGDPLVSQDGRYILVSHDEKWVRVDVATGTATEVRWRGGADSHSRVVACITSDIVLASTVTFRAAPRRLGLLSALDPPTRIRTFGLARLNTSDFQAIATFDDVGIGSFGQVQENREVTPARNRQ